MPEPAPHIEVLGFDCRACRRTHRLIASAAERLGIAARIETVKTVQKQVTRLGRSCRVALC